MQAADDELESHEVEDDSGDAEEALQIDLDAAANEEDAEDYGNGDAEKSSGEAEQFGGVQRNGGEDENGLDTFAQDEEEDEEEEANFGDACGAGVLCDFFFDGALHGTGGAMHEPDHADDKKGCGEHDPAFDDVGVVLGVGDDDGHGDAGSDGGSEGPEDGPLQLGPADLAEIGEDDSDDQRRLYPFAEGDDKCLQHKVFLFLWERLVRVAKGQSPSNLHEAEAALVTLSSVMRTKLVVNHGESLFPCTFRKFGWVPGWGTPSAEASRARQSAASGFRRCGGRWPVVPWGR